MKLIPSLILIFGGGLAMSIGLTFFLPRIFPSPSPGLLQWVDVIGKGTPIFSLLVALGVGIVGFNTYQASVKRDAFQQSETQLTRALELIDKSFVTLTTDVPIPKQIGGERNAKPERWATAALWLQQGLYVGNSLPADPSKKQFQDTARVYSKRFRSWLDQGYIENLPASGKPGGGHPYIYFAGEYAGTRFIPFPIEICDAVFFYRFANSATPWTVDPAECSLSESDISAMKSRNTSAGFLCYARVNKKAPPEPDEQIDPYTGQPTCANVPKVVAAPPAADSK